MDRCNDSWRLALEVSAAGSASLARSLYPELLVPETGADRVWKENGRSASSFTMFLPVVVTATVVVAAEETEL